MKYIFILTSFLYCTSSIAQFDKIDHLYISSSKAQTLYNSFKDFQLPIAWSYQDFGNFSSGAFSLGNAAIEFVSFKDTSHTEFAGIALQPHQSAEKIVATLDSLKILHDSIEPFTFDLNNGAKDTAWETVALKNILPDDINLFICDYKHREEVYKQIKKIADSLIILHGGKLGIINLKLIVVGCNNPALTSNTLSKLPGLTTETNSLFKFSGGPSIQLINSNIVGINKIVIRINSIDNAKTYLQSKNMLGKVTGNSLFISPQAVDGLIIELVVK